MQFVVEIRSGNDIVWLEKFNNHFVGLPILAIVHVSHNPGLLVSAMRAGAAQVVKYPLDPVDFRQAMERVATQFGHAPHQCEFVAVVGLNSAAGATSVGLNLSSQVARTTDARSLMIEGNLSHGDLASRLNCHPRLTIWELCQTNIAGKIDQLQNAIVKVHPNFQVIAGPYDEIHEQENNLENLNGVIEAAKQISDLVVIDMPTLAGNHYFDFLKSADQIVLVGEQKLESIETLKLLLERFESESINSRLVPVLNKYDRKNEDFKAERIAKLLDLPTLFTVRQDHPLFRHAETEGKTLYQMSYRAKILEDFDQISQFVMHQAGQSDKAGFFSRLFNLNHSS